ncbi:MAG: response regulator [Chloroflexi bacterium]|nr:response regulator [Chloroflexota bacterium]
MTSSQVSLTILIVEDNADHLFLARRAILQEMGDQVHVLQAGTGEIAIEILKRRHPYGESPRPDLVLLDVQLPGRDGFWVTRTMKSDPDLRMIPVVIFTSSDSEADVRRGYDAGGNVYVCKPSGADEFADRLRAIPIFWSRIALLPQQEAAAP